MYFKEKKAGTAKYGTRLLWGEEPGPECEQHSTLDSVTCENSGIAALIGELRRVLVKEGTSSPARLDAFANVAEDAQSSKPASTIGRPSSQDKQWPYTTNPVDAPP